MTTPSTLIDPFEAQILIKAFGRRITLVDQQTHHRYRTSRGHTDGFFQQRRCHASMPIARLYRQTVEIQLAGFGFIIHRREITPEGGESLLDKGLAQLSQIFSVITHQDTHHFTVLIVRNQCVSMTVLRVVPFDKSRHHPFEVGKRVIFACKILTTIMVHRQHDESGYDSRIMRACLCDFHFHVFRFHISDVRTPSLSV